MIKNHPGKHFRTWIEINSFAIKNNCAVFRKIIGGKCLLSAVVKSNAYGHSLIEFSKTADRFGVDWFAVDSLVEGISLRKNGIKKPILVLGHTLPQLFDQAQKYNISITISHPEALKILMRNQKRAPAIHIKIDTGMHRQGFVARDIPYVASALRKYPPAKIEGIYTHFATAREKDINSQLSSFEKSLAGLKFTGKKPIIHAANTAATLISPKSHLNMVRVGIGLYGLWPSYKLEKSLFSHIELKPALSWKTVIGEIKKIPQGSAVGYDFTEKVKKDSTIAICPVGYWHGYPRSLSGKSEVIVRRKKAKTIGRISMDMLVIAI